MRILALLLLIYSSVALAGPSPITCLAANIYHEARGESALGQLAVAHVTLNRVLDTRWPNKVCDVVKEPHQFSWTTNPQPITDDKSFAAAIAVARLALLGLTTDPTGGATHYHTTAIKPYWSTAFTPTVTIDNHIFYTHR